MCRPAPTGTCFWHNVPSADFKCGLERDTQRQVWQFMDPMSVVLEVGARFGTVSCAISKRQRYSGLRISLEPDLWALQHLLRVNVKANNCSGMQAYGVLSRSPASLPGPRVGHAGERMQPHNGGGYHIMAHSSNGSIPNRNVAWLQRQLAAHNGLHSPLNFTVLFIDCEGCAFELATEQADLLRSDSLRQVFLEADGSHREAEGGWPGLWQRYTSELFPLMCTYGLDVVAIDPNLTCCPSLFHVVFQRGGRCRRRR